MSPTLLFQARWFSGRPSSLPCPTRPLPGAAAAAPAASSSRLTGTPTGGTRIARQTNVTATQCCSSCHRDSQCNTWALEGPYQHGYYYASCETFAGSTGTRARPGAALGGKPGPRRPAAGDRNSVLAAFPSLRNGVNQAGLALSTLGWGGCQLSPNSGGTAGTALGRWTEATTEASEAQGMPLLLFSAADGSGGGGEGDGDSGSGSTGTGTSCLGRGLMVGPASHFFIALHSTMTQGALDMGLKASVRAVPNGTVHDTLVFAGGGGGGVVNCINRTIVNWGDVLLRISGKARVDAYADFALSHLGHWNDAGAFHYQNPSPHSSYQGALLAVKADADARQVPFRYSQWDDWWAQQRGDFGGDEGPLHLAPAPGGGLLFWQPRAGDPAGSVFPDGGLTDWLGLPLALYAPAYSAESAQYMNVSRYGWLVDPATGHALPTKQAFYEELFANGTRAGMVTFEQVPSGHCPSCTVIVLTASRSRHSLRTHCLCCGTPVGQRDRQSATTATTTTTTTTTTTAHPPPTRPHPSGLPMRNQHRNQPHQHLRLRRPRLGGRHGRRRRVAQRHPTVVHDERRARARLHRGAPRHQRPRHA